MSKLCSAFTRDRTNLRDEGEEEGRNEAGGVDFSGPASSIVVELGNAGPSGEVVLGTDMFEQSFGGRATSGQKSEIEGGSPGCEEQEGLAPAPASAGAGDSGVEVVASSVAEQGEGILGTAANYECGRQEDEGVFAFDGSPDSALGKVFEGLGRLTRCQGAAAEFPGKTGDVGENGQAVLCQVCQSPEGDKDCLICDECNCSFHVSCVKFRFKSGDELDEWLCSACSVKKVRRSRAIGKVDVLARSLDTRGTKFDGGSGVDKFTVSGFGHDRNSRAQRERESIPSRQHGIKRIEFCREACAPGCESDKRLRGAQQVCSRDEDDMESRASGSKVMKPELKQARQPRSLLSPTNQADGSNVLLQDSEWDESGHELNLEGPEHSQDASLGVSDMVLEDEYHSSDQRPRDLRAAKALEQLKELVAEKGFSFSLDGWTASVQSSVKDGRVRTFYFSPEKKRFASRLEVLRHLEITANVALGDNRQRMIVHREVSLRSSSKDFLSVHASEGVDPNCKEQLDCKDVADQDLRNKERSHRNGDNSFPIESDKVLSCNVIGSDMYPVQESIGDSAKADVRDACSGNQACKVAIEELKKYIAERGGVLAESWTADVVNYSNSGSLKCDVKYISPDRKVFRSQAEVAYHLGFTESPVVEQPQKNLNVTAVDSEKQLSRDLDKAGMLQQLRDFIEENNGTLSTGWDVEVKKRTGGNTRDKVFISPDKQKFRTRIEVARFLCLDKKNSRCQSIPPKSNFRLPIQCGDLSIESLGEVDKFPGGDGSTIWPVGYRCTWHDASTGSFCISEVADAGHADPLFRVTRRSCSVLSGRQDHLGSCSGSHGHSSGCPEAHLDLRQEMGEFAVEASSSMEAWKLFAQKYVEWCRSHPEVLRSIHCKQLPPDKKIVDCENLPVHSDAVAEGDNSRERKGDNGMAIVGEGAGNETFFPDLLEKMGHDRFGLTDTVVQNAIKFLAETRFPSETINEESIEVHDSQYVPVKPTEEPVGVHSDEPMELAREAILGSPAQKNDRDLPAGVLFGAELPSHLVGDVLQIWEFLCRFSDVIGIKLPSFNDFEAGLTNHWEASSADTSQVAQENQNICNEAADQTVGIDLEEQNSLGDVTAQGGADYSEGTIQVESRGMTALARIHIPLLQLLISDMKSKVFGIQNMEADDLNTKKKPFEEELLADEENDTCLPMNVITWPAVAHRYILALLALNKEDDDFERRHQHHSKIFRLIQGDGGALYGGLDGMAGAEADAELLADTELELFKLSGGISGDSPGRSTPAGGSCTVQDDSCMIDIVVTAAQLQEARGKSLRWAEILEPIAHIPTNTGARIRNRVQDSLKQGAPDWASRVLQWSISKNIFKGNAAGPTKHAVLSLLAKLRGEEVKPRKSRVRARNTAPSSALITQRCRLVLREVAAADTSRIFCFLYGNGVFDANECEEDGTVKGSSRVVRPLDLRTIDLRLEAGAYVQSPEAFAADVRQIWKNAEIVYKDGSKMLRLSQKLSEVFEDLYSKQVVSLLQGGGTNKRRETPDQHASIQGSSGQKPTDLSESSTGLVRGHDGKQESPEKAEGGVKGDELLKAPWDDESCRICGVDDNYDKVLLCDGCEAEYHTYCLKPPLAKVPLGKWFCPQCIALDIRFLEEPEPEAKKSEAQETAQCEHAASLDRSSLHALAKSMDGREYWQLNTSEMVLLLRTLCEEALETTVIRANMDNCVELSLELQQRLRLLVAKGTQPKKSQMQNTPRPGTPLSPGTGVQTRAERLERQMRFDEAMRQQNMRSKSYSLSNDKGANMAGAAELVDVVSKPKRGRPPKVKTSETISVTTEAIDRISKKRGRPPKLVGNSLMGERAAMVCKKRGRPPKRKPDANFDVPAKRRGRPPKRVVPTDEDEIDEQGLSLTLDGEEHGKQELEKDADKVSSVGCREGETPRTENTQVASQNIPCFPDVAELKDVERCATEDMPAQKDPTSLFTTDMSEFELSSHPLDEKFEVPEDRKPLPIEDLLDKENVENVGYIDQESGLPGVDVCTDQGLSLQEMPGQNREPQVEILPQKVNDELYIELSENASEKFLMEEIRMLEVRIMNTSLRREFLGRDGLGRAYWVVCGPGRKPQVAVEDLTALPHEELRDSVVADVEMSTQRCSGLRELPSAVEQDDDSGSKLISELPDGPKYSQWMLYETEDQLDELIGCLKWSKQEKALRSSLSQWRKSLMQRSIEGALPAGDQIKQEDRLTPANYMSIQVEVDRVFSSNLPLLRATQLLEKRHGPFCTHDASADARRGKPKRFEPMFRCICLEPIWVGRFHCRTCHETYPNEADYSNHGCCTSRNRKPRMPRNSVALDSAQRHGKFSESAGHRRKREHHPADGTELMDDDQQEALHRSKKLDVRRPAPTPTSNIKAPVKATVAESSQEVEVYAEWSSPQFLKTPTTRSFFGVADRSDARILQLGCAPSSVPYPSNMQNQVISSEALGLLKKSSSSRRSGRRKGLTLSAKEAEDGSILSKHSARVGLPQPMKFVDWLAAGSWGPNFNGACAAFSTPDTTLERVRQIGCIADNGPTFAPALSFAPAFDPSLMIQSKSLNTFTRFPDDSNSGGLMFVSNSASSYGMEKSMVSPTVSNETFPSCLALNLNSEDPLYHDDEGGDYGGSLMDFLAVPMDADTQGWTLDDGASDATGGEGRTLNLELTLATTESAPAEPPRMSDGLRDVPLPERDSNVCDAQVHVPGREDDLPGSSVEPDLREHLEQNAGGQMCDISSGPASSVIHPLTCLSLPGDVTRDSPAKNPLQQSEVGHSTGREQEILEVANCEVAPEADMTPVLPGSVDEVTVSEGGQEGTPCEKPASERAKGNGAPREKQKKLDIPKESLRPLQGNHFLLLKWLKTNLLDVEAALTPNMLEPARADDTRRRAWRAMVKSTKTLFEITRALFTLELMVKTEYLKTTWGHWFSLSAVLKAANISSVALRLCAFDAATRYEAPGAGNVPKKRGRKRKVRPEDNDDIDN